MTAQLKAAHLGASLAIGLLLAAGAGSCWAQASTSLRLKNEPEIAPFRLTGVDGYVQARYLTDESTYSGQATGATSRARQSNIVEEVFLMTHSYIYHPSLLSLDLGGGPVIDRSSHDLDGAPTNANREMYNLNARATVLRDKPYTGALFYDHRNQTQSMGPALGMLTENTRYGFNFALLNPVTPVPMHLELTRSENHGQGAEQVIDDRIDQWRLRMDVNMGKLGSSTFQYVGTHQDSASGSSGLPIQISSSNNGTANLDTRLKFGARSEYDLANMVMFNTNKYTVGQGLPTELRDFNFGLDLRGRHSDELQTYGRYNFNTVKQGEQEMKLNSANAGISYRLNPDLSGTLGARVENNSASQLNSTLYAIDGSAQYRQTLSLGLATMGYSVAYSQFDQQASLLQARTIGERVTLAGTTLATLGKQQILANTVVVSNLTRTQIFVEGQDYVLTQIGLSLRIQRLIAGNILDGQEVLIDYDYEAGGSYALNQLNNTINLGWAYKNYVSVFARYMDSAPHLASGAPTAPVNPVTSTLYGARADVPVSLLSQEFLLGGSAEHEYRRETILPYERASYEAYGQVDLPLVANGNIRVGTRQMKIDYDNNSALGVNLVAYDLRLWSRVAPGIDLSANASRERDTGTPVVRERSYASAKAQWRQRKLLLAFDLTSVYDVQGGAERARLYGQLSLRRDF